MPPSDPNNDKPLSNNRPVLVTGASGLVGRALAQSEPIVPLTRRPSKPNDEPWWEPLKGTVHNLPVPLRAVVHLAGENIASGRWTTARKQRIRDSRVVGTRTLVHALADLKERPDVLVMASGISFYGDQGDTELTEDSPIGSGFLADLSHDWEAEGAKAQALGIRVVQFRLGLVLSADGGVLGKMLPTARMGLGGPLGSGKQWYSWVHLNDVVRAIQWALNTPNAHGVYNLVAPNPVRQIDFAQHLGQTLSRPAWMPAPRFALTMGLGQMAQETALASHRVLPKRLEQDGFTFQWSELRPALSDLLSG